MGSGFPQSNGFRTLSSSCGANEPQVAGKEALRAYLEASFAKEYCVIWNRWMPAC